MGKWRSVSFNVPKRFHQFAEKTDWTKAQLCRNCGISRNTMNKWEDEDPENVALSTLESVSDGFGVSLSTFLNPDCPPQKTDEETEFRHLYLNLPEDGKMYILGIMRMLQIVS